tara:strand:- start:921 stop:2378 length:1458 start_codon:yes stop_codon:yes gene_type:complete
MKINIIHISDLHRDPNHPISNDALLNSLVRDIHASTKENPSIPLPHLIVVSGDVIQGTGRDTPNPNEVLQAQYEQAEEFLGRLADELVGGDRNRVVIVPGNHDIDFPTMHSSLEPVDHLAVAPRQRWELAELLFAKDSLYRWSWADFSLHKIDDHIAYGNRIRQFITFYDRFYSGARHYPEHPQEQFGIFDFPSLNCVIVGFNSCHMNDPWNKQGAIHPDAFAKACTLLRGRQYRGRLRLAVWHHSTKGGPQQFDYMDTDFLQHLIANGFSLGLHGHQHRPEVLDERYAFGGGKKVNVVSASTLCGGEKALAAGVSRGYNRLIIDNEDFSSQLHLRQMANSEFQNPIWCKGALYEYGSMISFPLQPPDEPDPAMYTNEDLREAEEHLRASRHAEAAALLEPLIKINELASLLLLQAFLDGGDNAGIVRCFANPVSVPEFVAVADALYEEGEYDRLRQLLNSPLFANHDDPSVIHIHTKLSARLSQ